MYYSEVCTLPRGKRNHFSVALFYGSEDVMVILLDFFREITLNKKEASNKGEIEGS